MCPRAAACDRPKPAVKAALARPRWTSPARRLHGRRRGRVHRRYDAEWRFNIDFGHHRATHDFPDAAFEPIACVDRGGAHRHGPSSIFGAVGRRSGFAWRAWQIGCTDDLAEGTGKRPRYALFLSSWQQREYQLGEAVRLFEVRIAREDEGLDTEFRILFHQVRHLFRIPYECRARAGTREAYARPEMRIDFEFVALAAVQGGHAPLAFRIHLRERSLRALDGFVVELADQLVRIGPGFLFRLPDNDVQANPEPDLAAFVGGTAADVGNLLAYLFRRLAPGEIGIDMIARDLVGRRRRTTEPQR